MSVEPIVLFLDKSHSALIHFRPGSTDEECIKQFYTRNPYDLSMFLVGRKIQECYQKIVKRGKMPLILDLGAYIGIATLWFNSAYPEARIVALEPEPDNFQLLRHNTQKLEEKVLVQQMGVSSTSGKARLQASPHGAWACQTVKDEEGKVKMRTVNDLVGQAHGCTPFYCKIDIEGAEKDLFYDNTHWFDQFPVVAIELHDWLYPGQELSKTFFEAITNSLACLDVITNGETVFVINHTRMDLILAGSD